MRSTSLLVVALLSLLAVPLASADVPPGCPDQRDASAISIGDRMYVKAYPGNPLRQVVLTYHSETNGLPGLQTWWTSCMDKATGETYMINPDRSSSIGGPIPL